MERELGKNCVHDAAIPYWSLGMKSRHIWDLHLLTLNESEIHFPPLFPGPSNCGVLWLIPV